MHIDATVDGNIMVGVCPAAVDAPRGGVAYKAPASMMFYAHNGRRCARRRASPRPETRALPPSRVALVAQF